MKFSAVWLFVLIGAGLWVCEANACVCVESIEEGVSRADVVFDGLVVEKKLERTYLKKNYRGIPKTRGEELTIEVYRVFKGEAESTIVVRNSRGSCGVQGLDVGAHVYIAAELDESSGALETDMCLFTALAGRVNEPKAALEAYFADQVPLMDFLPGYHEDLDEYLEKVGLPHTITGKFERAE